MAEGIGSLYVALTLDGSGFATGMRNQERIADASMGRITRSINEASRASGQFQKNVSQPIRPYAAIQAARAFENVSARAGLLRGTLLATTAAAGGFTAALSTNVLTRYADTFTNLNNRLLATSSTASEAAAKFDQLQAIAARSRADLSSTVTLFARLEKSAPGRSVDDLLRTVETVQKALQLGGATTQEAASAAIQFSQAIASNRLGGEELRAILETPLGGALAQGLGVTIGKLREMGTAGELTADRLFGALQKIGGSIDADFARSIPTLENAITRLDNALIESVGSLNKQYGVTRTVGAGINSLADNLDYLLPKIAALGLGLGTVFAGRGLGRVGQSTVGRAFEATRAAVARTRAEVKETSEEIQAYKTKIDDLAQVEARARDAAKGDTSGLAARNLVKELDRATVAAQRADEELAGLTERRAKAQQNLANVTGQTSARIVTAVNSVATAEKNLEERLARRADLQRSLASNDALQTVAAAQAATGRNAALASRAARERLAIQKQIAESEKKIAAQSEALAQRRIALAQIEGNERVKQSTRIIEAQRRLAAVDAEILAAQQRATGLRAGVGTARQRVAASGSDAAASNIAAAVLNRQDAEKGLAAAEGKLVRATRAASGLGLAIAGVTRAGTSLVSFLGGPWGVAFTAAIGAMTLLGVRAARTAELMEGLEQSSERYLSKLSEVDSVAGRRSFARDSAQKEIEGTVASLEANAERAELANKLLREALLPPSKIVSFAGERGGGRFGFESDKAKLFLATFEQLRREIAAGVVPIEQISQRIDELFQKFQVSGDVLTFRKLANDAAANAREVAELTKRQQELNTALGQTEKLASTRGATEAIKSQAASFATYQRAQALKERQIGKQIDEAIALELLTEKERKIRTLVDQYLAEELAGGKRVSASLRAMATNKAQLAALIESLKNPLDLSALDRLPPANRNIRSLTPNGNADLLNARSIYEKAQAISALKQQLADMRTIVQDISKTNLSQLVPADKLAAVGPAVAAAQSQIRSLIGQVDAGKITAKAFTRELLEIQNRLEKAGAGDQLTGLINRLIEATLNARALRAELEQATLSVGQIGQKRYLSPGSRSTQQTYGVLGESSGKAVNVNVIRGPGLTDAERQIEIDMENARRQAAYEQEMLAWQNRQAEIAQDNAYAMLTLAERIRLQIYGDANYGQGQNTSSLPRYAQGGFAKVGGAGGTDSQLVQFMASPNEHYGVFTPAQWEAIGKSNETRVYNVDNTQNFSINAPDPNAYRLAEQEILRRSSRMQRMARA